MGQISAEHEPSIRILIHRNLVTLPPILPVFRSPDRCVSRVLLRSFHPFSLFTCPFPFRLKARVGCAWRRVGHTAAAVASTSFLPIYAPVVAQGNHGGASRYVRGQSASRGARRLPDSCAFRFFFGGPGRKHPIHMRILQQFLDLLWKH